MLPLTVTQICSSRSWGGMEIHVLRLSEQLQRLGHRVTIWCAAGSDLDRAAKATSLCTWAFEPAGYFDPLCWYRVVKELRNNPTQILHVHYGKDLWVLVPANQMTKKLPILLSKHIGTQKPKRDPLHRYLYHRVRYLIAISRVIAQNLLETHPVRAEQVVVLHHGVDAAQFQDPGDWRERVRQEWGVDPAEVLIGTIGRLQVGKGHLEFLEMARQISKEFPQTRFVIVGEPTRGEEALSRPIYDKIEELQLQDRVLLPGFRQDIPAVLAALDLFAFPSRAEAFGLVLIEAMASGKAIVSTRCDGVLDIVEHKVNGLLFSPTDMDEFAAAVRILLQRPDYRNQLAAAGHRTVMERFSQKGFLVKLTDLYEKCFLPQ